MLSHGSAKPVSWKLEEENENDSEATKEIRNLSNIFNSDCVVWDLPAEDLMNPMV